MTAVELGEWVDCTASEARHAAPEASLLPRCVCPVLRAPQLANQLAYLLAGGHCGSPAGPGGVDVAVGAGKQDVGGPDLQQWVHG